MSALAVEEYFQKRYIIRTRTVEAARAALPALGDPGPVVDGVQTKTARVELGWNGPDYWTATVTFLKDHSSGQGIVV